MFLDVSGAYLNPGSEFPFVVEQIIDPQDILGEQVTFDTAQVKGVFTLIGESILLKGEIVTVAHAICANCLAPALVPVRVVFDEVIKRAAEPDNGDAFTFDGFKIDITPMVLSLTILNLPMRFLCDTACEGLCSECGAEKNRCTCQKEVSDQHPFAALKQLLMKDEEV